MCVWVCVCECLRVRGCVCEYVRVRGCVCEIIEQVGKSNYVNVCVSV